MKRIILIIALILGFSSLALAEHPFPFGKGDTIRLLNKVFDVNEGHNHDGVNSRVITNFPLASGKIIVGNASGVSAPVDMSGDATISNTGVTVVGSISAGLTLSTQDLTTTSDDPGTGTADLTSVVTLITSTEAGDAADEVSLADGVKGQIKILILVVDGETAGTKIIPAHFANGTYILLDDAGDSCVLIFDGTNWSLVANNGGTVS